MVFSTLLLLLTVVFENPVFSLNDTTLCDATKDKPCLVQDSKLKTEKVKYLRDALLIKNYYQGNIEGVNDLLLSLSAQPTEEGWQEIVNYIHDRVGLLPQNILVLDLRQESHGYLNGQAITLCDWHNWVNLDKTPSQVTSIEHNWLTGLSQTPMIEHVLSKKQFTQKKFSSGKSIAVETISDEETLAKEAGMDYQRLAITDHRAPDDKTVDAFVALMDQRSKDSWIHLHCRGGKGRSTTTLAMYDMLKNADKASFDDIIERLASIPPFYDLRQIERRDPELTPYYEARLRFLRQFYHYAQQRLAGESRTWSEWKALQPEDYNSLSNPE